MWKILQNKPGERQRKKAKEELIKANRNYVPKSKLTNSNTNNKKKQLLFPLKTSPERSQKLIVVFVIL